MLIALRKAQFTEITPSPVTTMVPPLTGRGHRARYGLSA